MVFKVFGRKSNQEAAPSKGKKKGKSKGKKKGKGKNNDKNSKGGSDDGTATTSNSSDASNALLEEVMKDNLELMRDIVMRIREDEDYAKTVYADCPRLQHLLDQHPDLRPVFEDPNLVRINFEQVYRKCGGVLPEDRLTMVKRAIACIVKHPLFKVFRVLLFIKKCYSCIFNGGFLMIRNLFVGIFTGDFSPDVPEIDEVGLEDVGNPANAAAKEALLTAADHFEAPNVQEQLDALLEADPDALDEAIEEDPELKALRETNPLCSELMSDPTTLRILVDPDNLRALAECPDLIEADFADPNWSPPDVESIPFDDPAYVDADQAFGMMEEPDVDADVEHENDEDGDDGEEEEEEEEEGFLDEFERGEEAEANAAGKKGGQQKKKQTDSKKDGQGGGFLSTIGTGLVDYIAAETVGMTASELMGGDDFGVDELEDQVDDIADEVEGLADEAEGAAGQFEQVANTVGAVGEMAGGEDLAENVEGAMDEAEDTHEHNSKEGLNAAEVAVTDSALGATTAMGGDKEADKSRDADKEGKSEDEGDKKRGRFGRVGAALGGGFGALGAAAKEFAVTAVIGEDLAEDVLDQMEDDDDESSSNSDSDTENNSEKRKDKNESCGKIDSSLSSLFRQRNK